MSKKESKKPSQIELLEQLVKLLQPISNLANHQISQINTELQKNQLLQKAIAEAQQNLAEQAKAEDENAEG